MSIKTIKATFTYLYENTKLATVGTPVLKDKSSLFNQVKIFQKFN